MKVSGMSMSESILRQGKRGRTLLGGFCADYFPCKNTDDNAGQPRRKNPNSEKYQNLEFHI